MQFHPILALYFTACATAVFMFFWSLRLPLSRESRTWGLVMLFCALWSAGDGLEILMTDLESKLIFIRISYLGVIGTAIFWPLFIVIYSNNERLLTARAKKLLAIVPAITLICVLTLDQHTLFYDSVTLQETDGFISLSRDYGPIFLVWSIFAYGAIFGSGVLLIQAVLRFPHYFHGQIYMLVSAGIIPLASNFLYITGNNFMDPFDPSAPAFVISGILVGLNLRHYRFMNVMPVAQDQIFRQINSGIIILDKNGLVLEINPAGEKLLGLSRQSAVGFSPLVLNALDLPWQTEEQVEEQVKVIRSLPPLTLEIQLTPFADAAGRRMGQLVMLYDITTLKDSEQKLAQANEKLQKLAAQDPLTGLCNRRHFFGLALQELARAQRQASCFSIILIDLDGFKSVNDTLGHPQGDKVLKEAARRLVDLSRKGELIARYGGDEFIVLSHGSDRHMAQTLARRYSSQIPEKLSPLTGPQVEVTLSIGIADFTGQEALNLDSLLERADQALYQSKRGGRNRISVWTGPSR